MTNTLHYGDNLHVLREQVPDESVDLIYLDPPFNSNANYNILFKSPEGQDSDAQIEAFEDTWHWTDEAENAFDDVMKSGNTKAFDLLNSMRSFLGENDMMAYLAMMAVRLIELHRVLKPTGSLYLHCDPTASHYLKLLLDGVFGPTNYRNEITWLRSKNPKGSQFKSKRYSPDTDVIFFYGKTDKAELNVARIKRPLTSEELVEKYDRKDDLGAFTDGPVVRSQSMGERPNLCYEYGGYDPSPWGWRMEKSKLQALDKKGNLGWTSAGKPYRKLRPADDTGIPVGNCWTDISLLNPQSAERLGYPTQKPLVLLERIISASSNEGDVVLDPFCGCGTAVHASEKLGRRWIGIDVTHLAISLIEKRMKDAFHGIQFDVNGRPESLASALDLAKRDPYQFQWWAVSMVDALPYGGKKKGADGGIDGLIYFKPEGKKTEKAIVSVKGGKNVSVQMIRDLHSTMEREKAPIGIFITATSPTGPMQTEAAAVGVLESGISGKKHPRLQILTIAELFEGKKPDIPWVDASVLKKAKAETGQQGAFKL